MADPYLSKALELRGMKEGSGCPPEEDFRLPKGEEELGRLNTTSEIGSRTQSVSLTSTQLSWKSPSTTKMILKQQQKNKAVNSRVG